MAATSVGTKFFLPNVRPLECNASLRKARRLRRHRPALTRAPHTVPPFASDTDYSCASLRPNSSPRGARVSLARRSLHAGACSKKIGGARDGLALARFIRLWLCCGSPTCALANFAPHTHIRRGSPSCAPQTLSNNQLIKNA